MPRAVTLFALFALAAGGIGVVCAADSLTCEAVNYTTVHDVHLATKEPECNHAVGSNCRAEGAVGVCTQSRDVIQCTAPLNRSVTVATGPMRFSHCSCSRGQAEGGEPGTTCGVCAHGWVRSKTKAMCVPTADLVVESWIANLTAIGQLWGSKATRSDFGEPSLSKLETKEQLLRLKRAVLRMARALGRGVPPLDRLSATEVQNKCHELLAALQPWWWQSPHRWSLFLHAAAEALVASQYWALENGMLGYVCVFAAISAVALVWLLWGARGAGGLVRVNPRADNDGGGAGADQGVDGGGGVPLVE